MQEKLENTHAMWNDKLFEEYKQCVKEKVVASFIGSFSSNKPELRSALSVFAVMQTFPDHPFVIRDTQDLRRESPCGICSTAYGYPKELDEKEIEMLTMCLNAGGLIGHRLSDYYYYLHHFNTNKEMENIQVNEQDILIFSEIIDIILKADENETLKKEVQKNIGKIKGFKAKTEERQVLLETLGYCSILETPKYKGLLKEYINLAVAPRKTHSSDWNYPVDFWLGKDGINKEAFKFWFGNYKQLERFWK
ncbi:hypothetical protein [Paenibacillus macquariensis]|uniref:Uncharacterized protein n=1 Tax=Paenibacillus macquariensis TaxID=948756 RepID=A0ABY1JV84_9BACL|nr:hypothetical protein [Paenibacillus macquariensis]MEC0090827.1 hypothetical protein [Paenibacillus macquariensis]OAB34567.1 hypothetical protein PMSM_11940 [Paenibacillus macquariensis subsp. macquariensis]SIQ82730.1 hypothetical protein SAMN05421578_104238 [Paenibacillus macquariensis]